MRRQSQPGAIYASCNAKPRAATLKMYLNVPQSSAERLQRTLFVSVSAPNSPISNRKEKT
jgi:hypothetical protein